MAKPFLEDVCPVCCCFLILNKHMERGCELEEVVCVICCLYGSAGKCGRVRVDEDNHWQPVREMMTELLFSDGKTCSWKRYERGGPDAIPGSCKESQEEHPQLVAFLMGSLKGSLWACCRSAYTAVGNILYYCKPCAAAAWLLPFA